MYDLYKKVSNSKGDGSGVPAAADAVLPGVDKSQAAEGKQPAKPKGRLYKGTPFLRGNTEDKLMI